MFAEPSENTDGQQKIKGPSHGDELAYLFEPLDDEGNPINEPVSDTDADVRDNFVGLISKFAHNTRRSKNATTFANLLPFPDLLPLSGDSDQYIKISDQISLDKDFR